MLTKCLAIGPSCLSITVLISNVNINYWYDYRCKYLRNGMYMLLRIARNKSCSLRSYSDQYRDSLVFDLSLEHNPLHDVYSTNMRIPQYFLSNDRRNIGFRYKLAA